MPLFIVNTIYQTEGGNFGSARLEIDAVDEDEAMERAEALLKKDGRRRYMKGCETSCSLKAT